MYETILYEVADRILTITLNRPERLNALNDQMVADLLDAFDRADADDDIGAIVVTGAGRAFCAGADLEKGAATFDLGARRPDQSPVRPDGTIDYGSEHARDAGGVVALRIMRSVKPVIAAVNGPAVGIGVTMTLPMDIRLASDGARFGFVFARRGVVPEATSTWYLPRIVGISRALEWGMTGRIFPAGEALEGGLVRSVHAPADLLPAAYALAREITDNTAPVSVALIRQMLLRGLGENHPMGAHRIESRGILARGRSADAAEGVTSFLEKRPARFRQRVSDGMPDFYPWWEEPEYS